ncbi:caspase family protein [Rhizobium laguerreae]|uniref:caspase family protein n=1 Tax=Rhizobium laguerreae TaxID=1076926 RepID=UPI001C91AE11|nr:caspase family protein [Rhizobium laguerreae]MBY3366504.1 hypothetical protein [Rhizobium laguerreae]
MDANNPDTTLLLILGAEEFPNAGLQGSIAFANAVRSILTYFLSPYGYRLPQENVIYFFDDELDPSALDRTIRVELTASLARLTAKGTPATDLIVYYVGHGSFDEDRQYFLALRSTDSKNQGISGLKVGPLMRSLNGVAGSLRKYVILDACYSGEAVRFSQSSPGTEHIMVGQMVRSLERQGSAFLCSSSREVISEFLKDGSNTKFTKALTDVLWEGSTTRPSPLSLDDLADLTRERISIGDPLASLPEIHMPEQGPQKVAAVRLFPNGPRPAAQRAADEGMSARIQAKLDQLERETTEKNKERVRQLALQQAVLDERRSRMLAEQEATRKGEEETLKRYSSDEERVFRLAAESIHPVEPDRSLLIAWLGWNAGEHKVKAGAFRFEAKEHIAEAGQRKYYASNIYDQIRKEEKSGSDDTARTYRSHWVELLDSAKNEEQIAAQLIEQAEEAECAAEFYRNAARDSELVSSASAEATATSVSFEHRIGQLLYPILRKVQRMHRMSRTVKSVWKWTLRAVVTLIILVLVVTCMVTSQDQIP